MSRHKVSVCAVRLCRLLALPLAGLCSVGAAIAASPGTTAITVDYDFPAPRVIRQKDGADRQSSFDRVEMDRLRRWGPPGKPVLPFQTGYILLPPDTEAYRLTVAEAEWTQLPGRYVVEHGQRPVPLSRADDVTRTPPDPTVYASADFFPRSPSSQHSIQRWRGHTVVILNLFPVRCSPATGDLEWCHRLSVTVHASPPTFALSAPRLAVSTAPSDISYLYRHVDNPEVYAGGAGAREIGAAPGSSLLDPDPAYDYLIITSQALASAGGDYTLQDLVDHKLAQGLTAGIFTTQWIYATYSGDRPDGGADDQTRIRNFIIDAYNTWGTDYVLLAGDADGADVGGESGDSIVPQRGFTIEGGFWLYEQDLPSDLYYGCLDGTFDYDGDGLYGEENDGPGGGEVDLLAEIHVGRIPVDSAQEISNFVAKQLAYTAAAPPPDVCMVGGYLGFGGVGDWAGNYKDEIKDGSEAHGYVTVGFLDSILSPTYTVSTLYDDPTEDWPPSQLIGIIEAGVHAINHLGHADVAYVLKLQNSDVDALTNTSYFVGYSQGCYAGAFDNRSGYPDDYFSVDCIAEHFTCGTRGAVAFIANSRYGWGMGYSTDGPSQHFDREFWDAILGEGIVEIGAANDDSKWDQAGYISIDPYGRWSAYETNLFGDPALVIKLGVSSRGLVGLDEDTYPLGAAARISVLDMNLNTNPDAPDVVAVAIRSTTESTPESVICTEIDNTSAIFVGSIDVTTGAASSDGLLQVSHGDTITVTYIDADDGTGGTNITQTDTAFADGQPPLCVGVTSAAAGSGRVDLSWPAASDDTTPLFYNVYRAVSPGGYDFDTPLGSTYQTTYRDESVDTWETYYYIVRAKDGVGNEDTNTAQRLVTARGLNLMYNFRLDTDPGWTCEGGWAFGQPTGGGSECGDPTSGHTGNNVYGYGLHGDYANGLGAMCLITTPLDCSQMSSVTLRFWRWLGVEYSYWDEAAVEVSADGSTWIPVWEHFGEAICDEEWVECIYDITAIAAGRPTVYIRWRLGPTDWIVTYPGWNIDDIEVWGLSALGAAGAVCIENVAYPTDAQPLIAVTDTDLNQNPGAPDTVTVALTSGAETDPEIIVCTETANDTSVFTSTISLATGAPAPDGQLQVSHGDTFTAFYLDADDGGGASDVPRTDTARVDGAGPSFTGIGNAAPGAGYVALLWSPASDDTLPIHYNIYRSQTPGAYDFNSPHAATYRTSYRDGLVTDLETYYYIVRAVDSVGNEEQNIVQRSAVPGTLQLAHSFPLDTDPGWSSQAGWEFGQPTGGGSACGDPTSGYTGANVYGYNLTGDYADTMRAFFLVSRPIDCSSLSSVSLRFWRWLGVEDAMWDSAALLASGDGVQWVPVWEHTGTTICDAGWVHCVYDISAVAARQPQLWLCWRMGPSDWMITYPGWNIDDIEIWGAQITVLFLDVGAAHWAFDEIQACYRANIVSGYGGGLYQPEWTVTRDQMAVFISRALASGDGNVPDGPAQATFNDVPADHWAYKYVEYCVANGVVQGFDPVTYGPAITVSRDAMAVFISRAVSGGDGAVPAGPPQATFYDVPAGHWAYKYVEYCASKGIVRGYDPVTYGPTITVSRDQMAVYITRAFGLPM